LLLIAAGGAALFAISEGFATLVLARALIGFGVAAAPTAGLKAIVIWFPRERVAVVNGYMVMIGALGALTATAPAELLLARIGWRGLFELLAMATSAIAVVIYLVTPEARSTASALKPSATVGLRTVYADARFWRLAPLPATCVGSAWALQGLRR
jgi:MFS family permease